MNSIRTTAVNGGTGTLSTPANNVEKSSPTNRRGSQEGTLFAGLMNQKRNSIDAAAAARRQSFTEQAPKAGFVGQMWNK
ncbi:conidiation-specific expression protein [Rutstroemia sp. NJR-2017a BBW]|nr:conidiation-specific expression protein [Rutstroemia sp. NJR-2017a BBW]